MPFSQLFNARAIINVAETVSFNANYGTCLSIDEINMAPWMSDEFNHYYELPSLRSYIDCHANLKTVNMKIEKQHPK